MPSEHLLPCWLALLREELDPQSLQESHAQDTVDILSLNAIKSDNLARLKSLECTGPIEEVQVLLNLTKVEMPSPASTYAVAEEMVKELSPSNMLGPNVFEVLFYGSSIWAKVRDKGEAGKLQSVGLGKLKEQVAFSLVAILMAASWSFVRAKMAFTVLALIALAVGTEEVVPMHVQQMGTVVVLVVRPCCVWH